VYLYIFEDGTTWQLTLPPTELDKEAVRDGYLRVFCMESGRFQEVNLDDRWVSVSLGARFVDPTDNREYSFNKERPVAELTCADADAPTPEHSNSTP
jgi:hypothetical protein